MANDLGTDGMRKVSRTCPKCNRDRVCSQEEAKEVYQFLRWVPLDDVEYVCTWCKSGMIDGEWKTNDTIRDEHGVNT
jgi:hypothetical protein